MDAYGRELLGRRTEAGRKALDTYRPHGLDTQTASSDVIANILTYVFGPATDPNTLDAARKLLERAFRSYEGDAEDYS